MDVDHGADGTTSTRSGDLGWPAMRVIDLLANSTSVIQLPDGTKTDASDVATRGRRLAECLRAEGLVTGDRVAVRLPNGLAYLEAIAGLATARLVLVSVNTRYSEAEVADLVRRSGARRVIDESVPNPLAEGSGRTIGQDDSTGADPYLVFTTSGTTSKPKMVRHRQRSIARHGVLAAEGFGYSPADVALIVMPFCGTFGLTSLMAALAANSTIVVADQFVVEHTAALIRDFGVTVVNGSDDMFHRLVEYGADLSSIRLGGYARFNTSLDGIVARAEGAGARLTGLYGMSEVQALFALRDPAATADARGLAGGTMVAVESEYRIVDGELELRGPSLFDGYLLEGGSDIDEELTGAHFDDGWFRTGDAAEADDDRTFTYHTRIGDVLRLGGFLVAPAEIELALIAVPGIDDAQVVAVDLPTGARPVAFVIAPHGFDRDAAMDHCRTKLAKYKVPVRIIAIDEFPVTPSANGDKIQRTKLRDLATAALRPDS